MIASGCKTGQDDGKLIALAVSMQNYERPLRNTASNRIVTG